MRIIRADALTSTDRVVLDLELGAYPVEYVNSPEDTGGAFVFVKYAGGLLNEPFGKWHGASAPLVVAD